MLRVLIPYALSYCFAMILRVCTATFTVAIMAGLRLNATQISLVISAYTLALALFQLPAGALIDKIGAKKTTFILMVISILGIGCYALSEGQSALMLGAILMGLGGGAIGTAGVRAVIQHLPSTHTAFGNGIVIAGGGIGGLLGSYPLEKITQVSSWQFASFILVLIGIIMTLYLLFIAPSENVKAAQSRPIQSFKEAMCSSSFWSIVSFPVITYAIFMVYQVLYISLWLHHVEHFNSEKISLYILAMNLGAVLGMFSLGFFNRCLQRFPFKPMTNLRLMTSTVLLLLGILSIPNLPMSWVGWLLLSFTAQISLLPYNILGKTVAHSKLGVYFSTFQLLMCGLTSLLIFLSGHWLDYVKSSIDFKYPYEAFVSMNGFFIAFGIIVLCLSYWIDRRSILEKS